MIIRADERRDGQKPRNFQTSQLRQARKVRAMDADETLYPTQTAYMETLRRIDGLVAERSEIDAQIHDEHRNAAQFAATIIRSMRAANVDALKGNRGEVILLNDAGLEVRQLVWADAVPLVAEDVFDKIPPIDPEPSLEEAIAVAQTHRTVWGEMMISPVTNINAGDFLDAFKTNLLNNWTPPTDAEIDAAAASGAVDDVFHADEEVE
jgi:hypothetical protein